MDARPYPLVSNRHHVHGICVMCGGCVCVAAPAPRHDWVLAMAYERKIARCKVDGDSRCVSVLTSALSFL